MDHQQKQQHQTYLQACDMPACTQGDTKESDKCIIRPFFLRATVQQKDVFLREKAIAIFSYVYIHYAM